MTGLLGPSFVRRLPILPRNSPVLPLVEAPPTHHLVAHHHHIRVPLRLPVLPRVSRLNVPRQILQIHHRTAPLLVLLAYRRL